MAQRLAKWHRLDNSAKIYPMMVNKQNQNLFRIAYEMQQPVDPTLLQQALELTLTRFPSFKVKLMKGIFWYYFDTNDTKPKIHAMDDVAYAKITHNNCNGYPFRVNWFRNMVAVDFFHAVTDGAGANEFVKSLIYTYLNLAGHNIYPDCKIKTVGSPIDPKELEDSFVANYRKVRLKDLQINSLKGKPAYRIQGILLEGNGKGILHMYCDVRKLLDICHDMHCTITELLGALLILSVYETQVKDNPAKVDDMQLFLPINLRKFFHSRTLRNFTLFSRVSADWNTDMQLETLIARIHDSLARDMDKQLLSDKIATTVRGEKFMLFRLMPLFLKKIVFNVGNVFFGKNKRTATFSNIGIVDLPEDMRAHVRHVHFTIGANPKSPFTMTAASTFGELCISFVRAFGSTDIERRFARYLTDLGIDVSVASNFWEVDHAL